MKSEMKATPLYNYFAWFFPLTLFVVMASFAQDTTPTPSADEIRAKREQHLGFRAEDFRPHMVDHPYQGCPLNSSCTKDLGAARESFTKVLRLNSGAPAPALRSHLKVNPLPIPVFVRGDNSDQFNDPNFIIWDSPCSEHQLPGGRIYLAEAFIKNFSELKKYPKAYSGLTLVESSKSKITTYPTPRDHAARFVNGDRLEFLLEESGNYYSLSVGKDGDILPVPITQSSHSPEATTCSKGLEDAFGALSSEQKLAYTHHICRSLYNLKTKKRQLALMAWSCKQ